jgi:hypothetical protein
VGGRWVHGGKVGDMIFGLSVIATHREGDLRLWANPNVGGPAWSEDYCKTIFSLLEIQPYIRSVSYGSHPPSDGEIDMDAYRYPWRYWLNLQDMQHEQCGIPYWPRATPWLTVPDPLKISRVVYARCPRYHNSEMPWKQIHAKYRKFDPVFVGHPDEHADLQRIVGPLGYYPTADYLRLARVIAGSDLMVCNQSSPHAVCEGLKKRKLLEVALHDENCHWHRPGAAYIRDGREALPDLDA